MSPLAFPRRPKPEMRTSSFSSVKFKQPAIQSTRLHRQPRECGMCGRPMVNNGYETYRRWGRKR
jgi:hypothetical protein